MKAYGKLAKDQALSKRVLLEHAFTQADQSGDRTVTIAEFVGYLAGAEDKLSVKPELFAEIAGFVKPEGMEYEIPKERRQKKGRWVEDEEPAPKPGYNPDGSRIVNFMATQPASRTASQDFLAGPSGSNNAGKKGVKGGAAAAAANAVRSAAPKKGGFMDRMAERAAFGVTKMANTLGEVDFDEGMEAAKKMGNRAVVGAMGQPGGGRPGQAAQPDSLLAKTQARALERRKAATQSKDPIQKMRSAEEEKRNEEAIERMALKRQNRSNQNLKRGADAGNFVKKTGGDPKSLGSGNEGLATRGVGKVLGKMGGGVGNKLLSSLDAVV